jgi:hypothetical protein
MTQSWTSEGEYAVASEQGFREAEVEGFDEFHPFYVVSLRESLCTSPPLPPTSPVLQYTIDRRGRGGKIAEQTGQRRAMQSLQHLPLCSGLVLGSMPETDLA